MVPSLTPEEALEDVCSGMFDLVWFGLVWNWVVLGCSLVFVFGGLIFLVCACATLVGVACGFYAVVAHTYSTNPHLAE
jgi:hypothetical protein